MARAYQPWPVVLDPQWSPAPAGPVMVDVLKQLSTKPIHTIVLSHFHADHAFGAWALLAAGAKP